VPPGVAKDFHELLGTPVGHLGRLSEAGRRTYRAEQLHHAHDAVQRSELVLGGREKRGTDAARNKPFDVDVLTSVVWSLIIEDAARAPVFSPS
jgi:hypothetical protein